MKVLIKIGGQLLRKALEEEDEVFEELAIEDVLEFGGTTVYIEHEV